MTEHERLIRGDAELEALAGPHLLTSEIEAFLRDATVDRERVELHRIWCPACAARIDRLTRLLDGPLPPQAAAPAASRLTVFRPWPLALAGGTAIVAVAIAFALSSPRADKNSGVVARNFPTPAPLSTNREVGRGADAPPPAVVPEIAPPAVVPPASATAATPIPAAPSVRAGDNRRRPAPQAAPPLPSLPEPAAPPAPAPTPSLLPALEAVTIVFPRPAAAGSGIRARSFDEVPVEFPRGAQSVTLRVEVPGTPTPHAVTFELARNGTVLWTDTVPVAMSPAAANVSTTLPAALLEFGRSYELRFTDRAATGTVLGGDRMRIAVSERTR